jgi:hypothetical protein
MAKTSNSCLGVIAGLAMAASFYSLPMGAMAGQWIKATFNGVTLDPAGALKTSGGTDLTGFTPSIFLYNYQGAITSDEAVWSQPGGNWSYYPLYGFGSLVGTDGFYGSAYNARNELLAGLDDTVSFSDAAGVTDLNFVTGRNFSGYQLYTANSYPNPVPFESISFGGPILDFVGFGQNNTNTDVVGYIAQALEDSGRATFDCASTCFGDVIPQAEDGIMFTWSSVTFEVVQAVPSPLPLVGAVAAFSYSRRLRKRVGGNRLAKIG